MTWLNDSKEPTCILLVIRCDLLLGRFHWYCDSRTKKSLLEQNIEYHNLFLMTVLIILKAWNNKRLISIKRTIPMIVFNSRMESLHLINFQSDSSFFFFTNCSGECSSHSHQPLIGSSGRCWKARVRELWAVPRAPGGPLSLLLAKYVPCLLWIPPRWGPLMASVFLGRNRRRRRGCAWCGRGADFSTAIGRIHLVRRGWRASSDDGKIGTVFYWSFLRSPPTFLRDRYPNP